MNTIGGHMSLKEVLKGLVRCDSSFYAMYLDYLDTVLFVHSMPCV